MNKQIMIIHRQYNDSFLTYGNKGEDRLEIQRQYITLKRGLRKNFLFFRKGVLITRELVFPHLRMSLGSFYSSTYFSKKGRPKFQSTSCTLWII